MAQGTSPALRSQSPGSGDATSVTTPSGVLGPALHRSNQGTCPAGRCAPGAPALGPVLRGPGARRLGLGSGRPRAGGVTVSVLTTDAGPEPGVLVAGGPQWALSTGFLTWGWFRDTERLRYFWKFGAHVASWQCYNFIHSLYILLACFWQENILAVESQCISFTAWPLTSEPTECCWLGKGLEEGSRGAWLVGHGRDTAQQTCWAFQISVPDGCGARWGVTPEGRPPGRGLDKSLPTDFCSWNFHGDAQSMTFGGNLPTIHKAWPGVKGLEGETAQWVVWGCGG